MTSPDERRQQLRNRMRRERRALGSDTRAWAATELCQRITASGQYAAARRIAAYCPFDGEIDTAPLVRDARAAGKAIYLPVLQPGSILAFAACDENTELVPNQYGIAEPVCHADELLAVDQLDIVLLPLVAFDYTLHRLGMGGGYYDRTLAGSPAQTRPLLLGVGYDLQCVDTVHPQPWDIAADAIITEACTYTSEQEQQ